MANDFLVVKSNISISILYLFFLIEVIKTKITCKAYNDWKILWFNYQIKYVVLIHIKWFFGYVFQHTERKYDRQNGHLFIYNGSSFLDDMKQTGTNTLCQNFGICWYSISSTHIMILRWKI